jgi:uncharacterized protein Yka (UPF0111/DUF47 family)
VGGRHGVILTSYATVLHMRRVQLQLTDDQADYLAMRASREDASVAELVRGIVDKERAGDERRRRIEVALEALKKPGFRSGLGDVAENHDEYFVQAIEERIGRR